MLLTQPVEFMKNINLIDLQKKIRDFRKLNFQDMTYNDIFNAILDTLSYNGMFLYITQSSFYPKGTKFYRVRELDGTCIPNKNLSILSDFWNPPEKLVKANGRLNKIGESLLYTSPLNPYVPIKEMKLKHDAYYALIVYEALSEVKVNIIGGEYNYDKLGIKDEHVILINDFYNDFLREEFSRDVGIGTEYLYIVSEIIAKSYFDLPRDMQDAWAYSSVQDKKMYNVCFRPDIAKDLLELHGAVIAKNISSDNIYSVAVTHGFDNNGIAMFYPIGSDVQKQYFPEIQFS